MKRIFAISVILGLIITALWQIFFTDTSFYLVSVIILILSMLPFFLSFEREEHSALEITLISSLVALAVVSRAVFYLVPNIKPIAAVVGISGACLGAKRGYLIGAFSMFVSNFIFGQGAWTPFQMVAMGMIGMIFGIVFGRLGINKYKMAAVGFVTVFVVYGLIVDFSSVIFLAADMSIKSIIAVYAAGAPFNLIFAVSSAVFLFLFGEPLCGKINRLNIKYAICEKR